MNKRLEAYFPQKLCFHLQEPAAKNAPGKRGIEALTAFIYGDLNSQMIVIESF